MNKRTEKYRVKLNKLPKFHKSERSSFKYWFSHWRAFQLIALYYKCWRFKYLFHDIEKPFLMILWGKDYKRVQKWHREHNRHHMEYKGKRGIDYQGATIDMECSRFTKLDSQWNAYDTWYNLYRNDESLVKAMMKIIYDNKYNLEII